MDYDLSKLYNIRGVCKTGSRRRAEDFFRQVFGAGPEVAWKKGALPRLSPCGWILSFYELLVFGGTDQND